MSLKPRPKEFHGLSRPSLASIHIQAKRYQEQSVGRPAVQSFYGEMGGQGAGKGSIHDHLKLYPRRD